MPPGSKPVTLSTDAHTTSGIMPSNPPHAGVRGLMVPWPAYPVYVRSVLHRAGRLTTRGATSGSFAIRIGHDPEDTAG